MGKGESPLHPNLWIIDKVKEDPKGELEFNNKDIEIWNEIVPNKDRGVVRTPLQTYKMESLATIVSGLMLLTIVAKLSTLDVCGGPGYASEKTLKLCSDTVLAVLFSTLTLSWRNSLSYRNQSTDLQSKPMD